MKSITAAVAASLVLAVSGTAANAQISDDVVKIGVLTDMSSLYADATGKGSLAAVIGDRHLDTGERPLAGGVRVKAGHVGEDTDLDDIIGNLCVRRGA